MRMPCLIVVSEDRSDDKEQESDLYEIIQSSAYCVHWST